MAGPVPFERPRPPSVFGQFFADVGRRQVVLALFLLVVGFVTVLVRQLPLLQQIVLGAPLFEEMLKFGLALLLCFWAPWIAVRLPVALAVGAGFGWLEHVTTYPDEGLGSYTWRLAFHGLSTGLSMAAYHAAWRSPDVRVRVASTVPATAFHFYNNGHAVLLGLLSLLGLPVDVAALWLGPVVVGGLLVALCLLLARGSLWRRALERRFRRWFGPYVPDPEHRLHEPPR